MKNLNKKKIKWIVKEVERRKSGVTQINSFSEGKQVMNLYLCPKDKFLTQSALSMGSIVKKTITFNVRPY